MVGVAEFAFDHVAFGCADSEGGFDDDVARGIRYAVDNGARILNLSLGADGPAGSAPVVDMLAPVVSVPVSMPVVPPAVGSVVRV